MSSLMGGGGAPQPAFNERLIQEVKKHPSLYNHSKRSFTDTVERSKIWDEIAAAIDPNVTGEFAKKRWLQLRDRYRKELKVAIRQNFTVPMRWCYFSHLSWLDPYLKDNLSLATPGGGFVSSDDTSLLDSFCKTECDDGFDEGDDLTLNSGLSALESVLASTEPAVVNGNHHHEPSLDGEASGSPDSVITSRSEDVDGGAHSGATQNGTVTAGIEDVETNNLRNKLSDLKEGASLESFRFLPQHLLAASTSVAQRAAATAFTNPTQGTSSSGGSTGNANLNLATQNLAKQLLHANRQLVDWVNDEDMLFARIVGLRLKKLDAKKRKRMRTRIMDVLDGSDEEDLQEVPAKNPKQEITL